MSSSPAQRYPGAPSLLSRSICMAICMAAAQATFAAEAGSEQSASSAPVLELDTTEITSNQLGTITEGSGSYTPGTLATSTRLVLKPRETPQTISVATRQYMDDFNLTAIDDVMRHTPGVTVSTYDSERTTYWSRGFTIQNFQYDGVPTLRDDAYASGATLSDMAIYDRVEVIKGASGLLSGAGAPGATINLIRKKPTSSFQGHVTAGAGSWDNYRTELDLSGPLTETGNIRGRAVAAYQDKHSFQDHYERKTSTYYGILEMDLTENTLLTLGADYQDNDPKGSTWAAIPLFDSNGNETNMPRSFNPGTDWSSWAQYTRSVFATLEHRFDNDWVAKGQLTHQINGYHAELGSASSGNPNPATGAGVFMYAGKYVGETKTDALDLYASGPFQLFGREHQLVVGTNVQRAHWDGKGGYFGGTVNDFYNWNGNYPEPDWGVLPNRNELTTRQAAAYVTARFKPTDELGIILGSRVTNYERTGDSEAKKTGKVIPYAGVTYDLTPNYTLYASYTTIFNPQSNRDRFDKPLDPDEGDNYELGIKGEWFDGRLNASLAYFEIHQDNRAEADTEYNNNPPAGAQLTYAYIGTKAKAKGFEAEISGELAPGWQVQGGYTHKVIRDDNGDKISTWEPEDQVNLFTTYRLPILQDKLTIGGGARWRGKGWQSVSRPNPSRTEDLYQDSYWLVDLMTRYQVTDNWSVSANLNNLFDKKYYTNIGFYNSVYYGDPRNVMFSTRYDF